MAASSLDLFYWPFLPGRGEFVRLYLEDTGASYRDVGRLPEEQGGGAASVAALRAAADEGAVAGAAIFAPPVLVHGERTLSQTGNILMYLAAELEGHELDALLAANQVQATIEDVVVEAHNSHHPISPTIGYEDQQSEAKRAAKFFVDARLPGFVSYFERALVGAGGSSFCSVRYPDLSMFHLLDGLEYAFPNATRAVLADAPKLVALRERVRNRPRIAAYLASERRLPFNNSGIFRHYPELDS